MVVQRIPGLGGGGGVQALNQSPEKYVEDRGNKEEEGEDEKKDPIIETLGDIGKYQLLVGLLFALLEIPHGWCMLLHKFISPKVEHWCTMPEGLQYSTEEWRNISSPAQNSCNMYSRYNGSFDESDNSTMPCSSMTYDNSLFQETIVQKWDLVCEDKLLQNISSFVFFSGTGVGVFIAGLLADKIGRRRTLLLFICLFCVSGLVCTFAPYFELWITSRFLWGAATLGLRSIKIVMSLEMVGSSWRAIVCVAFIEGGWTLGYLTLPLASWLLPNAFHLQLLVSLSILPAIPLVYLLYESPRWLLATGNVWQCRENLKSILQFNNLDTEVQNLDSGLKQSPSSAGFLDLFRQPMMRRNTIVISLCWFALGMLYFGLSLHMPEFNANIYIIFFMSGLVEIPADILPFILLNRFGRRLNLCIHYIVGGLLCMATAAVPLGVYAYEWPIVVLAMTGKYISQVCWGIVYLYTTELFPTVVRSVALSFACSMARLGSMLAPFIASLAYIDPILPIFIFGTITFIAGIQAILLPETNKKKLPNTVEEGELFYIHHNPVKFCS